VPTRACGLACVADASRHGLTHPVDAAAHAHGTAVLHRPLLLLLPLLRPHPRRRRRRRARAQLQRDAAGARVQHVGLGGQGRQLLERSLQRRGRRGRPQLRQHPPAAAVPAVAAAAAAAVPVQRLPRPNVTRSLPPGGAAWWLLLSYDYPMTSLFVASAGPGRPHAGNSPIVTHMRVGYRRRRRRAPGREP
jgi:hypothetical protein